MSEKIKLRECPFCGGEASANGRVKWPITHEAYFADGSQVLESFYCNCLRCSCSNKGILGHQTKEKAISKWNTRTEDNRIENALEEIEVLGSFCSEEFEQLLLEPVNINKYYHSFLACVSTIVKEIESLKSILKGEKDV